MVVNYNKSIIYKLCCKDPEITDIYIGSTTDFTKRKWQHKYCCNNKNNKAYNCNIYNFIRENGNWDNWDMVQIEAYKADSKRDLESRERYWIETLKSTLNKTIPTQTLSEYRQKNKEFITEQMAEYYQNNKEVIAERQAEYYQNNKEVIAENKAKYRQKNKEVIAEKMSEYYQNNKEVIAEKMALKVVCECGSEVNKSNLIRHKKTQKHLKFLETPLNLPVSIIHSA
jgi:adenylate kinase family enzyme